ncbi:hypothetical protein KIPB_016027, partial [Kipferlia bialata]
FPVLVEREYARLTVTILALNKTKWGQVYYYGWLGLMQYGYWHQAHGEATVGADLWRDLLPHGVIPALVSLMELVEDNISPASAALAVSVLYRMWSSNGSARFVSKLRDSQLESLRFFLEEYQEVIEDFNGPVPERLRLLYSVKAAIRQRA